MRGNQLYEDGYSRQRTNSTMDLISGLFERQWGARQARRRVEKIRGGVGTCHMLSDGEGSGKEGELPSKGNGFLLQGGRL